VPPAGHAALAPNKLTTKLTAKRLERAGLVGAADKDLQCRGCKNQFVWSVGQQEFYKLKGLTNEPTRCKACIAARKAAKAVIALPPGGGGLKAVAVAAKHQKTREVSESPGSTDGGKIKRKTVQKGQGERSEGAVALGQLRKQKPPPEQKQKKKKKRAKISVETSL
jgi:hypothetical protein